MAYNYRPAYDKNREALIKTRRELKELGVPSSALPKLPRKSQAVNKETAKIMRDTLRLTKDYLKAEKYLQKNPQYYGIIDAEDLVQQYEYKREYRRKTKKREKQEVSTINVYEQYCDMFEDKLSRIPRLKWVAKGRDYRGADLITDWWSGLRTKYSRNLLGQILYEAEQAGIILDEREAYKESVVKNFISEFMNFLRRSDRMTFEDYTEMTDTDFDESYGVDDYED